jgi:coatomer subunit beta'
LRGPLKHITYGNLCILDDNVKDGERLAVPIKDLGSCEIYPQTLQHSPNGRFAVVCGDGEYIIYTALSWRNKTFGNGLDFVWASDSNMYVSQVPFNL